MLYYWTSYNPMDHFLKLWHENKNSVIHSYRILACHNVEHNGLNIWLLWKRLIYRYVILVWSHRLWRRQTVAENVRLRNKIRTAASKQRVYVLVCRQSDTFYCLPGFDLMVYLLCGTSTDCFSTLFHFLLMHLHSDCLTLDTHSHKHTHTQTHSGSEYTGCPWRDR